ncbi:Mediator of DNA damage checkpoint protein 1 [Pseudolycoriella hygida]|uniref:PAX-interacting protein 1 n=1 Tax=Pseudolycoriella hygida TaxID=35572 RepID=A0A9Q0N117_9DIPT|nr:Mediator of DNA damage checkpoint protein 1 [Pseudolycoriella hygida]
MSANISDLVHQAVAQAHYKYEKVIGDVADGLSRSNFFENQNWQRLLIQCFTRTAETARANVLLHLDTPDRSDVQNTSSSSFFQVVPGNTSTPYPNQNIRPPLKRPSTLILGETLKKMKTSVDVKMGKMLAALKTPNWTALTKKANAEQATVEYETIFKRSRRLFTEESNALKKSTNAIANRGNEVFVDELETLSLANRARTRRILSERTKNTDFSPTLSQPAKLRSRSATNVAVVDTNITNKKATRRTSQLIAAYTGSPTDRRDFLQRTFVLFTMIDVSLYKDVIKKFRNLSILSREKRKLTQSYHFSDIFLANKNEQYDYLIAEKICRSPKFLSAVACGKPIVSIEWIRALRKNNTWQHPLEFLLNDPKGEAHYNFKLSVTLMSAVGKKLLSNYSVFVTPNTKISPEDLKGVIFSAGGKFMDMRMKPRKNDEVICVSDVADKNMWSKVKRKYPTLKQIISIDGFSKMILQYRQDFDEEDVLDR